ncbi:putative membrane protein, partial [Escherichia coli 99.0672]
MGVKTFAGINTKGGNMSDDISLAMEGALAVIAVVGV